MKHSRKVHRLQAVGASTLLLCMTSLSIADGNVYLAYTQDGTPRFSNFSDEKHPSVFIQGTPVSMATAMTMEGRVRAQKRDQLLPLIRQMAEIHSIDPALLTAVIDVESGFNTTATSPKGAMGLMQLVPKTAAQYGLSTPYNPAQNLDAGTRYLKNLLDLHDGNIALAIAAYNAGQGSVSRQKRRIPPYGETLLYVPRVLAKQREYESIFKENFQ